MSITKKQAIVAAALVAAGAFAMFGILYQPGSHDDGDGHGHGQESDNGTRTTEEGHDDEGVIKLTAEQTAQSDIRVSIAGPGTITPSTRFPGEIRFNADRLAHVVPRVAGIVEAVSADLGQTVKGGQVLAMIASTSLSDLRSELTAAQRRAELADQTFKREERLWNEKVSAEQEFLQAKTAREEANIAVQNARQKLAAVGAGPVASGLNQYALRAPFEGVIIAKHMTLGEAVTETEQAFTIADLRTVWAEFIVAPKDLPVVSVGEKVRISTSAFSQTTEGTVDYVGPLIGDQTRTATARVTLQNPGALWRPGLFITAEVMAKPQPVAIAVPASAIQTVDNSSTIFLVVPEGFKAQKVQVGRSDGVSVEVTGGLAPGQRYAATNTFTLKAELGKSEAEHAH
ncbi:efflux RND transporter periplasmic adaptor subunit [Pigmentiphaga sp. GD03639]|uniref:efflux RND transporter periplasmic adaptor subunit n=1 Tax=unclassified Pigmentiphaga TaxID=2626614 RepID=UPI000B4083A9|nr:MULTISPECIES: efflux RND transporter periplasmic adaptor subunit [unclassified Pigmentiphaga]MDH2240156.1 efflux RND transporter periplasmic adaptor subunit [Pigmentiphaga sp. GD03639]OVZ63426.1 efflux transporter periplasmic adaptor subunit [Pigmentiphaga sp. NML080357]OVZ65341.1 efflux transporter periplasmic adaptor subunit [Pigmentiphaga sp. NML030171]